MTQPSVKPGKPKVALLTREYPPEVYGGAGVHVEYLARELRDLVDLTVHCQGADRPGAIAHRPWDVLSHANSSLGVLSADLSMVAGVGGAGPGGRPPGTPRSAGPGGHSAYPGEPRTPWPGTPRSADIVHSHTWYTALAGHLAATLYRIPHVMTTHSLEPLRPWKAEQLGGGYAVSSWCEREAVESAAAIIAVSAGMRSDVLATYPALAADRVHVIRNGIDTREYSPDLGTQVLKQYAITADRPTVVFVGRITRQKGVPVLLRAAELLDPYVQLVLCAGQADTPELDAEVTGLVGRLRESRSGVIWINGMLPKHEVIQILSHATVFACPSLYEPLGIVNLEAMACGTAVVASNVGGIPEVVAQAETGLLVPPGDPVLLAEALTALTTDPARALAMGQRGRQRAVAEFSWATVAAQTATLYAHLLGR